MKHFAIKAGNSKYALVYCVKYAILFLILSLYLSASCVAATAIYDEVHGDEYASNCGIISCCFILGHFDVPFSIKAVADQLQAGPAWEQPVNMLTIKKTLQSYKLQVKPFKDVKIQDIASFFTKSNSSRVVLLHLKEPLPDVGHFIVLTSPAGRDFMVIDNAHSPRWFSTDQLNDRYKHKFDGVCLVVDSAPAAATIKPPVRQLDGHDIRLDFGEVPGGPGVLRIKVILQNPLDHVVTLNGVKGSCDCFKSATLENGAKTILPHGSAQMTFEFDRSKLGRGGIQRDILLSWGGLSKEWTTVIITGELTGAAPTIQELMMWYPKAIDLGSLRHGDQPKPELVTILLPPGISISEPNATKGFLFKPTGVKDSLDDSGRTVVKYTVFVPQDAIGSIRGHFGFKTDDKANPEVDIPIFGEVVP